MHIIYRTSMTQSKKPRPEWFSYLGCLRNALSVFGQYSPEYGGPEWMLICDGVTDEYVQRIRETGYRGMIMRINERHNARAFRKALDYACKLQGDVYLLEDDFLHRSGAPAVLADGLRRFDYVTLYDHPDKYRNDGPNPEVRGGGEETKVFVGEWCHWKWTNSTVATFAVNADTLRADRDVWQRQSQGTWPHSYEAFRELRRRGRTIGSSIPAYSTHCEPEYLAPLVEWGTIATA